MNLIDKMPKSYDDLHYKKYFKIMNTLPAEQPDYMDSEEWERFVTFHILSVLLDVPIIDLESLPAIELLPLIDRTQFFNKPPKGSKNTLKLKTMDKMTYDDFVNYNKLRQDTFKNIEGILKIMVLNKTQEELENMSVSQVYEVFFCLKRYTEKSLTRFLISSGWLLLKQSIIQIRMKMTGKLRQKEVNISKV